MDRLDARVIFHEAERIMEIDLTDLHLAAARDSDRLYDMLETKAAASGRKWFFLINYLRARIDPDAWVAFAHRGKKLNLTYSLGSQRFNTADEVSDEIARRADEEHFDANLARNREGALAKLRIMRDDYFRRYPEPKPLDAAIQAEFEARIRFDEAAEIMDADFSDFTFADSRIVNGFYDVIERRIAETGREKWYFLVNYRNCEVPPEAWVAYAHRGKRLNIAHSLGSVRYAASDDTAGEIAMRAGAEKFDPNLFPSREEALRKVDEMRRG